MAKMLTVASVEQDLAAARQLLKETEEQWHEGTADYKRLDAVKQEVAFRQGLLEAVTKREAERERQAQAEAQRKIIEQKNRQKAQRFLETAPARLEAGEAISAVVLKAHTACEGIKESEVDAVRFVLGVVVETLEGKAISSSGRGHLVQIRQNFLGDKSRNPLPRLRKEIAQAQETLGSVASTNGTKAESAGIGVTKASNDRKVDA